MIVPALIGLSVAAAAAHGAFHRNSRVFGPVLGKLPTDGRDIALTFDDGPNPDATPRILDTLAQFGVRATFFILGKHAELWPELVQRIVAEGHQVGNHGYYHRRLHFKSRQYVRRDLRLGTTAIVHAAGKKPAFFRAPHGFRSPWVSAIAESFGQRTVGWSLGVWDSDLPGVSSIVDRAVTGARPGSIMLLHDGDGADPYGDRSQTSEALPRIISGLRDRDFRFVTLPA
jgi:peptidoglycan/xylan/chitin deacetylase (PgdA/CDA1 family)